MLLSFASKFVSELLQYSKAIILPNHLYPVPDVPVAVLQTAESIINTVTDCSSPIVHAESKHVLKYHDWFINYTELEKNIADNFAELYIF